MNILSFDRLTKKIGIDLGSSRTRIFCNGEVLIDEPTCLAVDKRSGKVVAVGREALEMRGRVAGEIVVHRPVRQGKLYDLEVAKALLRIWLDKAFGRGYFFSPIIMVSVPATGTPATRDSIIELIYSLGAREVYSIAQPLAAAIGAGVPIADASGSFIFQLGSGLVEVALISLGSIVVHESSPAAGESIDKTIAQIIEKKFDLKISLAAAEKLKKGIGSVNDQVDQKTLLAGQDIVTIAPKEVEVSSTVINDPLLSAAVKYEQLIAQLLSKIPPELTTDVIEKGMLLSGGLAQLKGLDQFFIQKLGIPVSVVEESDLSVIKGIGTALEHLNLFKESMGYEG